MLGDSHKAQEVFHTTLREAALGAAQGQLPKEPFWLFRDARWRCLEATKTDLQPESLEIDEHEIAPGAPSRDVWRRGGDSCRHGWTLSIPNNANYEDAAVIATSTRPFELRAI